MTAVPLYAVAVSRICAETIDEISSGDLKDDRKEVLTMVFVSPSYLTWMDGLSEPGAATSGDF